jgi:isopentenyldiphosphate isomerase
MGRVEVPLVNSSGKTIGYGDRWQAHRVRNGPEGLILGKKHVGITIVCLDGDGRVLTARRRHRIFDQVWTLSGDTHPYRFDRGEVENLSQAAKRCAADDLGIETKGWGKTLTVSYSARDPRDSRYCENELLHLMATRQEGPFHVNAKNAYELRWAELVEISRDSTADLGREPIDRKYAPWVHAVFSLPREKVYDALKWKDLSERRPRTL